MDLFLIFSFGSFWIFFLVCMKEGMVLSSLYLDGAMFFLEFFNFILSWQIENGIFVQASTWMGRWMELEGHMNSSREIDVGLFSGTPCLCNRRSLANGKLLLKTIQKWHWASAKHYEESHANFTRALLNLDQRWVSGSSHAVRVAKLKYINGSSMNGEPNPPLSPVCITVHWISSSFRSALMLICLYHPWGTGF